MSNNKGGVCFYILLISILSACSSGNTNPPPVHFAEDDYAQKMHSSGADTVAHAYTVNIEQMKFIPDTITVKKGDTVVFVNQDMVTHDITDATSKAWTSGALKANTSWRLPVTHSADYFCSLHPVMKGKIIMQ